MTSTWKDAKDNETIIYHFPRLWKLKEKAKAESLFTYLTEILDREQERLEKNSDVG